MGSEGTGGAGVGEERGGGEAREGVGLGSRRGVHCLSYFFTLIFLCLLSLVRTGMRGLRKPQLDGDLRGIRSGGEKVFCILLP